MIYYLNSPDSDFIVVYRINLNRDALVLPSMTQVWEAMSFHERETFEMFGIDFKDHPNLLPLLLPPDWKGGYPLRKDFKGEGITE
jgi:NADH:ubiquinone oxidoreductase subunit C